MIVGVVWLFGLGRASMPDLDIARAQVVEVFKHSWYNYREKAWGYDEILPVSGVPHNWLYMASTLVDSLSTLWIMGLQGEFQQSKKWIEENLKFDTDKYVSLFETNIRILGGLISAYDLSGEDLFLTKAVELGDKMMLAFDSTNYFPHTFFNFAKLTGKNRRFPEHITQYGYAYGASEFSLAEFGTLQLEFTALSERTGDLRYKNAVIFLIDKLDDDFLSAGLYPNDYHPRGTYSNHRSWAGGADSFYEYLLKSHIQTGSPNQLRLYSNSVKVGLNTLLKTNSEGLKYLAELSDGIVVDKMDHLTCFAPGMLLLGTEYDESNDVKNVTEIAEGLMKTCYLMYNSSKTGLSSESVWFQGKLAYPSYIDSFYALRPETVESLFYFSYFKKDPKYREWGWDIFQSIELWCRAKYGYSELNYIDSSSPVQKDVQQSFFLAETLLYLYLLFSDPAPIELTQWVFNTEAHPLKLVRL